MSALGDVMWAEDETLLCIVPASMIACVRYRHSRPLCSSTDSASCLRSAVICCNLADSNSYILASMPHICIIFQMLDGNKMFKCNIYYIFKVNK